MNFSSYFRTNGSPTEFRLEVETPDQRSDGIIRLRVFNGYDHKQVRDIWINLDSGEIMGGKAATSIGPLEQSSDLADALHKILDWKRSEGGVYVPKIEPGDTVIVDRPNAPEVKVLDVAEQAFERVPKRKLRIEGQSCTCSMRDLLTYGCKCGGQ